jgi:acyl-[acyl-carrier-protein]-phospholipid O-acyltransferase / long-chain-fatty-acid--[acyl-carrier-protein] ligase
MKQILRFLLRWLYGFRILNSEVLSTPGPVLLIPNHVSWLDWLFVGVCLADDWKFVTSSVTAQTTWIHRWIMVNKRTFPIDPASPYAVKRMAEYLQAGGRLVLFAEGRISMTGSLMKLYEGTGFLLHKTNAKVITCHLRNAQRIPWVRHEGWTQWFPTISVHFSPVATPPTFENLSAGQARMRLTSWLSDLMIRQQFDVEMEFGPRTVLGVIAKMAAQRPEQIVLEDATRQTLTYRRLMLGTGLLAGEWRHLLKSREIGVLLPNINGTVAVLLSLWSQGRIPAILNYSSGMAGMLRCVQVTGLKQIITSRQFLQRAKIATEPWKQAGIELIFIEDVRTGIHWTKIFAGLFRSRFGRGLSDTDLKPENPAAILFTSGSEGEPKAVELSHRNLIANIRQMLAVIDLTDRDRMFNALPIFHSFGLTIGTLLPLVRGLYTFLYLSPLHYRLIPTIIYDRNCTLVLATNTFLNGFARRANFMDFRSVRYLFAGAEKLQEDMVNTWARKFGVRVLEGYGATECSPCLAVNTPRMPRFSSVGRFLPAIEYRLEPVDGVASGGRLFVRGPNIMRRYINAEPNVIFQALNGWYDTGDIARVDDEGHVEILGRLKRFAKISGEMVSLTAIEDALGGAFTRHSLKSEVVIVSRPDADKGEALIAVTNEPRIQLDEIRALLKARGFSNLCVPREVSMVKEIPKLGTGKTDYRELCRRLELKA